MVLRPEHRERYREQGYFVLPEVIPGKQLAAIRDAAAEIVDGFDIDQHRTVFSTRDGDRGRDRYFMQSAENISCFLEADALDSSGRLLKPKHRAINKIGHALHDLDPAFQRFCRQPLFREILQTLGYQTPLLWQSMYIFKQPGIGGEVRWHQDASYLYTEPASVTGIWVALEDASLDNGCLWVQPKGHKTPLRELFEVQHPGGEHQLRSLNDTPWPSEDQAQPLEAAAGTVVVFHDHLPHYSAHNHSEHSRQAFTMHLAESTAVWSQKNWLQRPTLPDFRLY